ncbi:unnamed protein product [Nippostrongylus brasiliensis]|uniref:Peptidase_S9 domain-containing protein n=1 Tax=Nippostrongylus brasiliensis TaxID=27835 RepID=A0A0N4XWB9_NIPBR|nr:unnamed protein product [Nippostrongylus brasiliensis]
MTTNKAKSEKHGAKDGEALMKYVTGNVHVGIMKPPKFDLTFKYPVIVDVYGGPNSCRVRRSTPNPNVIHFCSNLGAIVVWIDGRGANNRGIWSY